MEEYQSSEDATPVEKMSADMMDDIKRLHERIKRKENAIIENKDDIDRCQNKIREIQEILEKLNG